jgi:glutaminyl-tRNA synthetase
MYDWAHGQSDALEGITHSLCTLEFESNRALYDWFLDQLDLPYRPEQTEFARLQLNYTVMSKRKLLKLVQEGLVRGWDDPRMPTLSGMRRRGYTPESIREFAKRIGMSKSNSVVDIGMLEFCIREDLNQRAPRAMAVLNPLRVVLENYPEGQTEQLDVVNHPQEPAQGTRSVPFGRTLYIEADDFMENPPGKFFRLAPGREVRLNQAYYITCNEVVKDEAGNVVELRCAYDPETRGGSSPDGRKVKGTLHWVSADQAVPAEIRLYDHLFAVPDPENVAEGEDFTVNLNPDSLQIIAKAMVEPALATAAAGDRFQFMRQGYFAVDPDSTPDRPVFNQIVSLRDTWGKMAG